MNPAQTTTEPGNASVCRFDVAVCYRIYPRVSGKPIFGFTDKLALVHLNLETFKAALGKLKTKLYFLLDSCPPEYESLVRNIFHQYPLEVIWLNGVGNGATFSRQVELLSKQTESELVYFAEDDYLYLPGALEICVNYFKSRAEVEFATLYDHPDYYSKFIHQDLSEIVNEGQYDWRKVSATCLTFMARRAALQQTMNIFHSFAAGNSDLGLWLALTKRGVRNPWKIIQSFKDGRFVGASHALAWRHAFSEILLGSRHDLWAPKPSLATHMEMNGLAPNVDWKTIFDKHAQAAVSGANTGT